MRNFLAKVLPIALGIALGWLIINPPDWPAPSGAAGFLLAIGIVIAILVASIVFTIGLSLPKEVKIGPHAGVVDAAMTDLARQIRDLGFMEAGGPYLVEVRPAAVLLAFVHSGEPVYATVFRTGTLPAVTSYDFVSVFGGGGGGLTTSTNWRGGTMPSAPGDFRQILPGAGPKEAFESHREGLSWLRNRGLRAREISATTFIADFKQALGRQREAFRSAPLKNSLIALARTVFKRIPQRGLLASQKDAGPRTRKMLSAGKG